MRETQEALIVHIRRGDRAGANALLDSWVAKHGRDRLFTEILEPVLLCVGEEWRARGSFTLAQAYVAGKIAEDSLAKAAADTQNQSPTPTKGPVVMGNIEEDFHALGRRMVGTFLRSNGWDVVDLGNDVSPADFVDEALKCGARIIGVSAMMLTTAMNIRRVRALIDERGLTGQLQLAVGGAVFLVRPELVTEVGGDGTAGNSLSAAQLMDDLWARSMQKKATP